MVRVQICEDFGWTYQEYMNQPVEFIELIKKKMELDAKRQEREQRKHG